MKDSLEKFSKKLAPSVAILRKYKVFIFFILVLLIYSMLVFRINTLSSQEPDDSAVTAKLKTVTRPRIDQSEVDKIQQLKDNSVQVKALFNKARSNPFQE